MTPEPIDFEEDVKRYPEFIQLLADKGFCARLWTAFANVSWYKKFDPLQTTEDQIVDILTDNDARKWSASFRGMGGVIANLRNQYYNAGEDYMDWYCSNWHGDEEYDYGFICDDIREALNKIGWFPVEDKYYKDANAR